MEESTIGYESPMMEVMEIIVEKGFAGSGSGSGTESWQPGESI